VVSAGATLTLATGTGMTTIVDVPFALSLVAVITAVPGPTAVMRPFPSTATTFASLVDHVTLLPVSGTPFSSSSVAVSCCDWPIRSVAVGGSTVTVATAGGVTVMFAVPDCPSASAVMTADPAAMPVTRPDDEVVAIWSALLDQVTVRPSSGCPAASSVLASSCTVR